MIRAVRRRCARLPVCLAAIVLLLAVTACGEEEDLGARGAGVAEPSPTATEAVPTATPTPIDENDPYVQDAQMYADAMGVTLEEALDRLSKQELIGDLNGRLEANERETFAGAFLQHSPEYRFVVLFTRDGEETIRKYVEEGSKLDEFVEVREVRFSLVELQQIMADADAILGQLEYGMGSSSISVTENRVEYYVQNREQVEQLLADAGLVLPEGVALIDDGGPPVSFDPPEQIPGIYIAISKPNLGGSGAQMEALMIGQLILTDGCIRVQPDYDGPPVMPVWPHGFGLHVQGDVVEVVNAAGEVVARVGEQVYMGGGGVGVVDSEWLHHPVPEACQGDESWIVGQIDPLPEQPVIPTSMADDTPFGLHTVAWPDNVDAIEALLAALPDTLNGLPRWDGRSSDGLYEVGYGSPDDSGSPRLAIIDLTTGTYYPNFWTVNDLIASRFMSHTGISSGFYAGLSWAEEDLFQTGRQDAIYPHTPLHALHWGHDPATWLFSAYASDKATLDQLIELVVAAGSE